jgi:hypothetical protein
MLLWPLLLPLLALPLMLTDTPAAGAEDPAGGGAEAGPASKTQLAESFMLLLLLRVSPEGSSCGCFCCWRRSRRDRLYPCWGCCSSILLLTLLLPDALFAATAAAAAAAALLETAAKVLLLLLAACNTCVTWNSLTRVRHTSATAVPCC